MKRMIFAALALAACEIHSADSNNEAAPVVANSAAEPDPYNRTAEQLVAEYQEHIKFSDHACAALPDDVEKLSGQGMSEARRHRSIRDCLKGMVESRAGLVKEGLIAPTMTKARQMVAERERKRAKGG